LPIVLFLVMRRPPRATPFPYTTLFRSSPLALRTFPGQPSEYAGKRGAGTGAGQACWSTAAQRMAEPSDLSPTIVETLYYEALTLADEARAAFDLSGRLTAASLDEDLARIALSCEALRTTTRMMHAIAWLLNQ